MLFNFICVIVGVWVFLYILAYFWGFSYIGLVTREHDGQYELMEFWYNEITESYRVIPICRASEKTYNVWNAQHNITELHKMIDDIRSKYKPK